MLENNSLLVIAEADASRFGVFAMCSQRIQLNGSVKRTYYLEAMELKDIDGVTVPVAIDYIPFNTKSKLLKAFKNYSIK